MTTFKQILQCETRNLANNTGKWFLSNFRVEYRAILGVPDV